MFIQGGCAALLAFCVGLFTALLCKGNGIWGKLPQFCALLKTGTVIAVFHSLGTAPTEMSWLKTMAGGRHKEYLTRLKSTDGMSSGPLLELDFNLVIERWISVSLILMESRVLCKTMSRQTGVTPSSVVPTDEKY